MIKNRQIMIGLLLLIFVGCKHSSKRNDKPINKESEVLITNFSRSIFSKVVINSKDILDTLQTLSDTIYIDTAKYFRTPKATVYANTAAGTYFQVFENPKGTITAITFYKNKTQINVAEYFGNGQVMCKFNTTDSGVRVENFFCYYEDGKFRKTGYYKNGVEIRDSFKEYKDQ